MALRAHCTGCPVKPRRLETHDIVSFRQLEQRSFPGRWTAEDYLAEFAKPNRVALVIGTPGKVVAGTWYAMRRGFLELLTLATLPRCRGQGLGKVLIDVLKEEGQPIRAWVAADNRALRFYAREGFKLVRSNRRGFVRVVWTP